MLKRSAIARSLYMVGTGSALRYPTPPLEWIEQIMWFDVICLTLLMSSLLKKLNHFLCNSASFRKGKNKIFCNSGYFLSWVHFSFEWDFLQPCTHAIFPFAVVRAKHGAILPRLYRRNCFTWEMKSTDRKITTNDFCYLTCTFFLRAFNGINPKLPRFRACPRY